MALAEAAPSAEAASSDHRGASLDADGATIRKGAVDAVIVAAGRGEITTTLGSAAEAGPFWYAEDYHQQYLHKNPGGYCNHGPNGLTCPVGIVRQDQLPSTHPIAADIGEQHIDAGPAFQVRQGGRCVLDADDGETELGDHVDGGGAASAGPPAPPVGASLAQTTTPSCTSASSTTPTATTTRRSG